MLTKIGGQIITLPILRAPGNKATRYHAVLLVPLTTLPKFGSSRKLQEGETI